MCAGVIVVVRRPIYFGREGGVGGALDNVGWAIFPGHLIRQGGRCVDDAMHNRCWRSHVVLCIYGRWVA